MKHIVFVVGKYFPQKSGNSIIVKNLVDVLSNRFKVSVIYKVDDSVVNTNINEYFGVNTKYNLVKHKIYNSKIPWILKKTLFIYHKIIRAFEAIFSIPFYYRSEAKLYLEEIRKVHKLNTIDVLLPICFPIEALVASKSSGIMYIPILFDKVAKNINYQRSFLLMKLKYHSNTKLEKKIIENSFISLATNDWKDFINELGIVNKITYIKIPTFNKLETSYTVGQEESGFLFAGALSLKNRNPKYMVRIMLSVLNEINEELVIYGNSECDNLIQKVSNNSNRIIKKEYIDKILLDSIILKSKILISVGNNDVSQTPSKIYDYMSKFKPILHFAKYKNDPVNTIINEYPLGLVIVEDNNDEELVINKIIKFYKEKSKLTNVEVENMISQYKEYTPDFLANTIGNLIAESEKNV